MEHGWLHWSGNAAYIDRVFKSSAFKMVSFLFVSFYAPSDAVTNQGFKMRRHERIQFYVMIFPSAFY